MYSIRDANLNDLDKLLSELKSFASFYGTKLSLFGDVGYSKSALSAMIQDHLFLVCEKEDDIVGFISGLRSPHIYNPEIKVITESFWWVNEEYRGSRAGLKLLDSFIERAKQEADWVICTLEDNSPVRDDVFIRRGFRPVERSFLLEV